MRYQLSYAPIVAWSSSLALSLLLSAAGLAADEAFTESRTHFNVRNPTGTDLGQATKIERIAKEWDRIYVLYRSVNGDEVVIEEGIDFSSKRFEIKIRDLRGDRWIAARWTVPYAEDTRAEALKGVHQNFKLYQTMPGYVVLETNGGTWEGYEKDWIGAAKLELTIQLRRAIPFEFLEAIERTRSVYWTEELGIGSSYVVDHLSYRQDCAPAAPLVAKAVPDCSFDKSFGFACSKQQKARAENAGQTGQPPERY